MPTKLTLTITGGVMSGKKFTFEEHDYLPAGPDGRLATCACRMIPASRAIIFLVEVNPPDARLRDLGSLNGTYVNGGKYGGREKGETPEEGAQRQYPEVDLKDGDSIKVGDTIMLLSLQAEAVCVECHKAIPEDAREQCAWVGGTYICAKCRQKVIAAGKSAPKAPNRCAARSAAAMFPLSSFRSAG